MPNYGTDISTYVNSYGQPDLDPMFTVIEGDQVLLESCMRRAETVPGTLLEDTSYGLGLALRINSSAGEDELELFASEASTQFEQDERIAAARVTVSVDFKTRTMSMRVDIEPSTGREFSFVANVDLLTMAILGFDTSEAA